VTIVDAEELGGAMTEKLAELFDENTPPRAPVQRAPMKPKQADGKPAGKTSGRVQIAMR